MAKRPSSKPEPAAAPAAQEPAQAPAAGAATEVAAQVETDEGFNFTGKTIAVRSVAQGGRRRAGMSFGPEPTELQADELDVEVIASLLADAQLVVEVR